MRVKHLFITTFVLFATIFGVSSANARSYQSVEGDPLKARIYTLDNGLKIYLIQNNEEPRIQTFIGVKAGGKNDPSETTGLAHYFEHLMFKGTEVMGTTDYAAEKPLLDAIEAQFEMYRATTDNEERLAIYSVIDSLSYEASKYMIPNEYSKAMGIIGSSGSNAYTSNDRTVYIEDIPSNQLDNWAKIEGDRFKNIVIRGFHTELETVYEEKNMYLSNDGMKSIEAIMKAVLPDHPYGTQSILGTQEHLKNPSITTIKQFHDKWYVPNNMAVCMSGDFDFDEAVETIERYFGYMVPNPNLDYLPIPAEDFKTDGVVSKDVVGQDMEHVSVAWRVAGDKSEDSDKLEILSSVIYNGKAGFFDLNLNQTQKVTASFCFYYNLTDAGIFILRAVPSAGETLEQAKDLMVAEIAKVKAGEFSDDLLSSIINNRLASKMRVEDTNGGRAELLLEAFCNDKEWSEVVAKIDQLRAITKEDIVELANRVLDEENYAIIYKRQGEDKSIIKMPKPEITPLFINRDGVSELVSQVQQSEVEQISPQFLDYDKDMSKLHSKSKLPILYKQNKTNDLFQLIYAYDTGSASDKSISLAFNYLKFLGAGDKALDQINQELYSLACSYSLSVSEEKSYISITGLSENMDAAIKIVEDLLTNAKADEQALATLKGNTLKGRSDQKLNKNHNLQMLRNYATYGTKSPYADVLSDDEIMAITSAELIDKIKGMWSTDHTVLYYGPLSERALLSSVNTLHKVPNKRLEPKTSDKYTMPESVENIVYALHYDSPQVNIALISNSADHYDLARDANRGIYNKYIGDITFQELREARGLAYSAWSAYIRPSRLGRPFSTWAGIGTQNDKMFEALDGMLEILNNMPISETGFYASKESTISQLQTERIIKMQILWSYIDNKLLGVDFDKRENIYNHIQTITLEDLIAFQNEYVKDRKYTFCILGNTEVLDMENLSRYGEVKILTLEEVYGY